MNENTTSWIGGVKLGWIMVSAPLATLIASPTYLVLKTGGLGTYRFCREDVLSIECNSRALLGKSIKITHSNLDAPIGITFFCLENPQKIVEVIHQLGFVPEGHSLGKRVRQGIPVRWAAILIAIAVWNLPFLTAQWYPSVVHLRAVTLVILLLGAHLLLANSFVQSFILRPGRRVGEIRPFLKLCIFTSWIFVLAYGIASIVSRYPTLILPLLSMGQLVLSFVIGYPALRLLRHRKRKS